MRANNAVHEVRVLGEVVEENAVEGLEHEEEQAGVALIGQEEGRVRECGEELEEARRGGHAEVFEVRGRIGEGDDERRVKGNKTAGRCGDHGVY